MHGNALELVTIRQDEVGMEFQAALLKAAKHADYLLTREQLNVCAHGRVPSH